MKIIAVLFFVTSCFGQSFSRAEKILQLAENTKINLQKAVKDLDAGIISNDRSLIANAFCATERYLNEISLLQWQAKDLLRSKSHDPNFSQLGQIKLNQLDGFSREKFEAEHRKLCAGKKKIRKFVKEYELRNNTPELSFLDKISP
jgi:BMFP domain-containing protein YqiC